MLVTAPTCLKILLLNFPGIFLYRKKIVVHSLIQYAFISDLYVEHRTLILSETMHLSIHLFNQTLHVA